MNDIEIKLCSKCGEVKNLEEFTKRNNNPISQCKKCFKQYQRRWYLNKREEIIQRSKTWNLNNKEHRGNYLKDYRFKNMDDLKKYDKEYHHKYYLVPENKEHMKEQKKQYFKNNPGKRREINRKHFLKHKEKIHQRINKYSKERYNNDVVYRINRLCRGMVQRALNSFKSERTMAYFMCSLTEFKYHIERLWLPGMTWDNRGNGPGKWNIDHIIPVSFFNMTDEVEKYMCCRWQNLQPLWWKDNMKKGYKVNYK
jgi:hypothetical protein